MRSGTKSLVEALKFLEALHAQLLNVSKPESQSLEVYGVMCPRWAASEGVTEEEARALMVDVIRRRAMQSVPILYSIKVLRELLKEQEMSTSLPASAIEAEENSVVPAAVAAGSRCAMCRTGVEHRWQDHRAALRAAAEGDSGQGN